MVLVVGVNRRNGKHRTTVHVRFIWYEMRKHEQTACAYIDIPPSLHPFRIHEFDFVDADFE